MVIHNSLIVKTNKSGRYTVGVVVTRRLLWRETPFADYCNKIRVAAMLKEERREDSECDYLLFMTLSVVQLLSVEMQS